ncbi:MAG: hypothetical protein KJO79_11175 [Verrucomicrobiae bacterium]|nr:hypothetical protein [Verrucomicrobiae bacterium]NNJ87736.1 hypothetical protein [Akkermansiaceae bacterium]
MKDIRTFIFCSSVLLVVWLGASYTTTAHKIDTPAITSDAPTSVQTATNDSASQPSEDIGPDQLTTTASLQGR